MNMFKTTTAKTPEEYISLITDTKRRKDIEELYYFLKKQAPSEKPNITSGMIGFGLHPYKSKSGREGEWPLFALASQRNYISFYVCASDGKQYLAEKHAKDFPKASVGKSCVRFKKIEDIDLEKLETLIKAASKQGLSFTS